MTTNLFYRDTPKFLGLTEVDFSYYRDTPAFDPFTDFDDSYYENYRRAKVHCASQKFVLLLQIPFLVFHRESFLFMTSQIRTHLPTFATSGAIGMRW